LIRFLVSFRGLEKSLGRVCKSLHPGSIPGEASNKQNLWYVFGVVSAGERGLFRWQSRKRTSDVCR
jgi:hypothetical protein